jgi:hypothetical protein
LLFFSLPRGFLDSGNQPLRGHFAELDAADTELAHVAFGPSGELATVVHADGVRVAGQLRQTQLVAFGFESCAFSAYLATSLARFTSRAFIDSFAIFFNY